MSSEERRHRREGESPREEPSQAQEEGHELRAEPEKAEEDVSESVEMGGSEDPGVIAEDGTGGPASVADEP
ncbi:MAG TPA: hypothetical protein VE225_03595, partial [Rubrobacteraceae bacterium]|nr:hypothetical protein [Rubrobacteraceae bacterium]